MNCVPALQSSTGRPTLRVVRRLCGALSTSMIKYLWALMACTFLLSVYNWYVEGYFSFGGFCISNIGAVAAPILATLTLQSVSKFYGLSYYLPFKLVAVLSVSLSLVAYAYYALSGRAENSGTSAAQMHVILVPVVLLSLTLAALLAAFLASVILKLVERKDA